MTDSNGPKPARTGDAATGAPATRPANREPAPPRDPTAERNADGASGGESTRGDPEALNQSVGREEAGQGDARTRDGAI